MVERIPKEGCLCGVDFTEAKIPGCGIRLVMAVKSSVRTFWFDVWETCC